MRSGRLGGYYSAPRARVPTRGSKPAARPATAAPQKEAASRAASRLGRSTSGAKPSATGKASEPAVVAPQSAREPRDDPASTVTSRRVRLAQTTNAKVPPAKTTVS